MGKGKGNPKDGKQTGGSPRKWKKCATIVSNSYNDISFYNKNPQLLKDAGSLSYNQPLGLKVGLLPGDTKDIIFPGVCLLNMTPSIGDSDSANSNWNIAMNQIYSFIRHKNSGSANYEAADYGTYIFAMANLYAYYSEMTRLYGLTRIYSQLNRYINRGIIDALGYDYENIIANSAQLRYYINNFAQKLNTFCVPKELDIFRRFAELNIAVFKDSNDDKAQLYVPRFINYYQWSATAYETGSSLVLLDDIGASGKQIEDIMAFGDQLLNAVYANEDIGIMSGDTLKAYGEGSIYTVLGISEDHATLPIFNEGILAQIHNCIVAGNFVSNDDIEGNKDIVQKIDAGSYLYFKPAMIYEEAAALKSILGSINPILDCGYDSPTPEFTMESTRLMTTFTFDPNSQNVYLDSFGVEIVNSIDIFTFDDSGVLHPYVSYAAGLIPILNTNAVSLEGMIKLSDQLSKFDWAPHAYIVTYSSNYATINLYIIGEVFNYVAVSKAALTRLHNVAVASLLNIPKTYAKA